MGNRHDARLFVNTFFAGNATDAILAISSACGVAVAYQDRTTFECRLGRPISDEKFEAIIAAGGFDGYDNVVDDALEYSDVISDWMHKVLDDAGLTDQDEDDEDGEDDHRFNSGECAKCGGPAFKCRMTPDAGVTDGSQDFDCHMCEKKAFLTDTGVAHHLNLQAEGVDYDADADHVPFTLTS